MNATRQPRAAPRLAALWFGTAMLAFASAMTAARADQDNDAERVPSSAGDTYSPIERTFDHQTALPGGPGGFEPVDAAPRADEPVLFQDLKERLRAADPFFRDMRLSLYTRTSALGRDNAEGPPSKAWALGSALALRTGFLDDWLQFELAGATSQPLWAPEGEGGTLLLTENQAEVSSLGIANAHLRGLGQELTIGRQLVKTPYINPQDSRMVPNAVEGVALMRRHDEAQTFDYGFGYLWGFKARDSSYFVPFSQRFGVAEDRGVAVAGAKVVPMKGLTVGAVEYLIPDVLNTAFAEGDWIIDAGPLQLRFSVNYTDQRTVGADLIAGGPYDTRQFAERFAVSYADVTLLAAASQNGDGAALQSPFGSFPAYTVLDQLNFNNAGQDTVVVGAAYDLSHLLLDGLKFQTRCGWSWGSLEAPDLRAERQNEFNIELEYLPTSGPLKNIHVQLFYSAVEFPNGAPGETQQPQVHGIITYLIPLL